MHLTTSAADFSKETLVVKEEETYDVGAFEKVEAEVVNRLKEHSLYINFNSFIISVDWHTSLGASVDVSVRSVLHKSLLGLPALGHDSEFKRQYFSVIH